MNNFPVIVKQITRFDGRRANEFLEWDSKLCTSLSVYTKIISNVLQKGRSGRQSSMPTRRPLDAKNQDLFSVLFFTAVGSAFSVGRRF